MFRNVYWHHAVRAATVMYKRVVADALQSGALSREELIGQTDEGLLHLLYARAPALSAPVAALRERKLPKRAAEVVAAELGEGHEVADWLTSDGETKRAAEEAIAAELQLPAGSVFLDYPEKKAMFGLDILVQRRNGEVLRLGPRGRAGLIGLPGVSDELYRTARVLRVFVLHKRVQLDTRQVVRLAVMPGPEIKDRLQRRQPLLG
jgi:hypothetical protein